MTAAGVMTINYARSANYTRSVDYGRRPNNMLILGIESSCDETAAAVVKNGITHLLKVQK